MGWQQDLDTNFMEMMRARDSRFAQYMQNAVRTSYYKYGSVRTKTPALLKSLKKTEAEALQKDGNHEHLINIANYDMFLYMLDNLSSIYMFEALECVYRFDNEKYKPTDSEKSVTTIRKTVNDWLREDILNG